LTYFCYFYFFDKGLRKLKFKGKKGYRQEIGTKDSFKSSCVKWHLKEHVFGNWCNLEEFNLQCLKEAKFEQKLIVPSFIATSQFYSSFLS
jgi:hypothetical protein